MRLSKTGYYADFVCFPLLLLAMVMVTVASTTSWLWIDWSLAFFIGVASWTLLEYVLHRVVFHHAWPFRPMHALHHASPTAMIGTPIWITIPIMGIGIFLPLWREIGFNLASGLITGLMLGYLWYVVVHHAVHHWRARPGTYLDGAKRRHAQHHHLTVQPCNFGVTTAFWDRLFRTSRTIVRLS